MVDRQPIRALRTVFATLGRPVRRTSVRRPPRPAGAAHRSTTSARRCTRSRSSWSTSRPPAARRRRRASPRSARSSSAAASASARSQTLVNPGVPIPPTITVLTGITEAMVLPAPRIAEVLPAFLEFLGDARDRRPQRPLRHRLPRRRARPRTATRRSPTARSTRSRARPPPGARRGARTAGSRTLAAPLPPRPPSRATAPSTTRWPPPRCCTCCSSGPARSACSASTTCSRCPTIARAPAGRQARAHRASCPAPRASTCSATAAAGCSTSARPPTCARACARYFSRRRPAQGRRSCCARPQAIDHVVVRRPARGRGARDAPHPRARAPLQPAGEGVAAVRVPEAHPTSASPASPWCAHQRDDGALVPRPVPLPAGGAGRERRDRDRDPAATVHPPRRAHGRPRRRRRACPRSSASPPARAAARAPPTSTRALVDEVVAGLDGEPERLLGPLERRMHTLGRRRAVRGGRERRATGSARSRARSNADDSCAVRTAGRVVLEECTASSSSTAGGSSRGSSLPRRPSYAMRRRVTRSTSCSSSRAGSSAHRAPRRVQRVDGVLASALPASPSTRRWPTTPAHSEPPA